MDRDISPVGVVVVGSKYEVASINEVFCKKLGYEKAEIAGKSLMDIASPADQDRCKRLFLRAAENKEAGYNSDVRFLAKNGATVHTKVTVTKARDHCETTGQIFVAVEDFVRPPGRKASSHAKRLAQVEASARILMHELRNQLHGITLIARCIEQESTRHRLVQDDSLVALNQSLTMRLKDMGELVQDLSRLGQSLNLKLRPTDLAKFVSELLTSDQACHSAEQLRIKCEIAADLPLVRLDRRRFKQAWLNLLKNAVEAMPSGGTITVRLYRSNAHVCLEIQDTGTGVPHGIDIFERFTTTKPGGIGLGLGIVREIVSAHGGVVLYQSTPHTGACFTISLPLAVASRSDC